MLFRPYADKFNTTLHTLSLILADNQISDAFVNTLAPYIRALTNLKYFSLDLSGNEMTDVGMKSLMSGLTTAKIETWRFKINR
jgi:hypothetical protein